MSHVYCKDHGGHVFLTIGKTYAMDLKNPASPGHVRVINNRGDSVCYRQGLFDPVGHVLPPEAGIVVKGTPPWHGTWDSRPCQPYQPTPGGYGVGQSDPTGRGQHERGAKVDAGKLRPGLVLGGFARALLKVTAVGTMGAVKYTEDGWTEVPNGEARYEDAGLRHWLQAKIGEELDPESGVEHLAHEAWNALARLDLALRRKEKA